MLAVMAARTRMHSRPSRKTRIPISSTATLRLVLARVGSGEPPLVSPCQVIKPSTTSAAESNRIRWTGRSRRAGTSGTSVTTVVGGASATDEITPDFITTGGRPLSADCYSLAINCALNVRVARDVSLPEAAVVICRPRRKISPCGVVKVLPCSKLRFLSRF